MDKVGKRAAYAKDLLKTCTTAPPTGLGIRDFDVITTPKTKALTRYITLLVDAATMQNWVMSMVAMVPCVQVSPVPSCTRHPLISGGISQSYYLIAEDLQKNSAHKGQWGDFDSLPRSILSFRNPDTPWYKLWVEENVKYEDATKQQRGGYSLDVIR